MATLETQYKNYQIDYPDSTLTFDEWKKKLVEDVKSSMKRIFDEISTPEYKQKQIEEHQKYLDEVSMDFQLGYFVGENIVNNYLPTLSTDMIHSRKVIQVNEEDTIEIERLNKESWINNYELIDKEKWKLYLNYKKMLEKKYLPQTLECVFSLIRIDDIKKFKEGLKSSLWNCDMCSYNVEEENIEIYNDLEIGYTHIKFKYDPTTNDEIE
jgi:hypothetical protein